MRIVDLRPGDHALVRQVAALLVESFAEHWPNAWPDLAAALAEVHQSFGEGRLSRVAVDDEGTAVGWVGGIRQYDGHVWELHPLVVSPARRRQGIGRALVTNLEERVRERGGLTLWLGTDDEDEQTTLGGVDLYPDVLGHLAGIRNLRGHPYEFYQKLGFTIVGAMPDANGPGRPDIFMAKPVGRHRRAGTTHPRQSATASNPYPSRGPAGGRLDSARGDAEPEHLPRRPGRPGGDGR